LLFSGADQTDEGIEHDVHWLTNNFFIGYPANKGKENAG
jgi:hypothetical protein